MGSANGVADAAGLLKPKLKPAVDADVVAGGPVKKHPSLPQLHVYYTGINQEPGSLLLVDGTKVYVLIHV